MSPLLSTPYWKIGCYALLVFWLNQRVYGQADSVQSSLNHTVHYAFAEYDQEVMYFGKHDQYFRVRIFQKNGKLFREDSYTLLPKTLANGAQLDSISRILHHGPTKIMYPSGNLHVSCDYKNGSLSGPFMAFYEDGAIKRREYYKSGRLTKSRCYTPDGAEQACQPYYQNAQFLGKTKDLENYMRQKLNSILDGERVWRIVAYVTINEIGQVVRVNVMVNTIQSVEQQVPAIGSYVQQVIRNMPEWVPDQFNWKPALNDGTATSSTCVLSLFRAYGSIECHLTYR